MQFKHIVDNVANVKVLYEKMNEAHNDMCGEGGFMTRYMNHWFSIMSLYQIGSPYNKKGELYFIYIWLCGSLLSGIVYVVYMYFRRFRNISFF